MGAPELGDLQALTMEVSPNGSDEGVLRHFADDHGGGVVAQESDGGVAGIVLEERGQFWEEFKARTAKKEDPKKVLDEMGIERYCCRSLFLTHVDLTDKVGKFQK